MGCETAFGRFCIFRYPPQPPQDTTLNVWAYIDGFNLYNGALKGTSYKWLNLHSFSQSLRPTDNVSHVKYFTARVNVRPGDPGQPNRQQLYWRAIRSIGTVEIIEGHFLTRSTYLPEVTSLDAIAAKYEQGIDVRSLKPDMAHVYRSEEKGTDVNLAVQLVHDAHLSRFDAAIIVSNDSDLARAVKIVRTEVGKQVFVFHPHSSHPSFQLKQSATRFRKITISHLQNNQFPLTITDANGVFSKPKAW